MRNQLETFKTLFEQIRELGISKQLPNNDHTSLSKNIKLYFAENYEVTSVTFGTDYDNQIDIMKYSLHDSKYKVSFMIDSTDEKLDELINTVTAEFKPLKIEWLKEQIAELETEVLA